MTRMILVAIRAGARRRRLLAASVPVVRVRAYASRDTRATLLALWLRDRSSIDRVRELASPDVVVIEPSRWSDAQRDRLRELVARLEHRGAFSSIAAAVA